MTLAENMTHWLMEIADEIILSQKACNEGCYWDAPESVAEVYGPQEDLMNGACGIALFLIELFDYTGDEEYLYVAEKALKWAVKYSKHGLTPYNALLSGKDGVCYSLVRLFEVTQNAKYLKEALGLARTGDFRHLTASYADGAAGSLIMRIYLYKLSQESCLHRDIEILTSFILENSNYRSQGLFWERSCHWARPPIGMGLGPSGIAFVLIELGALLGEPDYFRVASQAFKYEASMFESRHGTWFNVSVPFESLEDYEVAARSFSEDDRHFFNKKIRSFGWYTGCAGIGLSRLRATRILKSVALKRDAEVALRSCMRYVDKCHPDDTHDCTLLTGLAGIGELFVRANSDDSTAGYLQYALKIASLICHDLHNQNRMSTHNLSFMKGRAGIGYYFLCLLKPTVLPWSPLFPAISQICKGETVLLSGTQKPLRHLMESFFPRISVLIQHIVPEFYDTLFVEQKEDIDLLDFFIDNFSVLIESLPSALRLRMIDVFELERRKLEMDLRIDNFAALHISQFCHESGIGLPRGDVTNEAQVIETMWNWSEPAPKNLVANLAVEPEKYRVRLVPTAMGIVESMV